MHKAITIYPSRTRQARRGTMQIFLLLLLVVFVLLLAWVMNNGLTLAVHAELRRLADAAALAGVSELVDDDYLRAFLNPDATETNMPALILRAFNTAEFVASQNSVNGTTLLLENQYPANDPDGDIVVGFMDNPDAPFVPATDIDNKENLDLIHVNAVRIRARMLESRGNPLKLFLGNLTGLLQVDLVAQSTAMLDRDVIGFQPVFNHAIPLAPIALLADFSALPDVNSWQWQVEDQDNLLAQDNFNFDGSAGSDGLREFSALVGYTLPSLNVRLLFINSTDTVGDFATLNNQLLNGVTATDLTPFGGRFVLDGNNELVVKASDVGPSGLEQTTFEANLATLRDSGAIRLWPLYTSSSGGEAVIQGFVAARIVKINPGDPLELILQPTTIITSAAVTNHLQRGENGAPIFNPYISKVRLVE